MGLVILFFGLLLTHATPIVLGQGIGIKSAKNPSVPTEKTYILDLSVATMDIPPLTLIEGADPVRYIFLVNGRPQNEATITVTGYDGTDLILSKTQMVFTQQNWQDSQSGMINAKRDDDKTDDVETLTVVLSDGGFSLTKFWVVEVIDVDKPAQLSIPSKVHVNEGSRSAFSVGLMNQPSSDVTVLISGHEGTDVRLETTSLILNSTNIWRSVNFSVAEDDDEDDETVTLRLIVNGEVASSQEILIDISDIHKTSRVVEGGSGIQRIWIESVVPIGPVTITISGFQGSDLSLDREVLTFTSGNYHIPQKIVMTASEDNDSDNDVVSLIGTPRGGLPSPNEWLPFYLEITILDNDLGSLNAPDNLIVDEGEKQTFGVSLTNLPTDNVSVTLTGYHDSDLILDKWELTFTQDNWGIDQEVTITAGKDDDLTDDSVSLEITALDGGYKSVMHQVQVTIVDLDKPNLVVDPDEIQIEEGKDKTFKISLGVLPYSNVDVTVTEYEDTDLVPDPQMLTFSQDSYSTPQTVTLITTEDTDMLNDEVTLTLTASGGGYSEVSHSLRVTIRDNMGVSIEAEEPAISITLGGNYPNPVSKHTNIVFNLSEPADISIRVTDLLGRTVRTSPYGWHDAGTNHIVEIDANNLTSGVYYYILRVDTGDRVIQRSKAMSIVR